MSSSLYSLRRTATTSFSISKFDPDYNHLATYTVNETTCTCPRGQTNKPCRHQKIMLAMLAKADSGWFLDWETKQWHAPLDESKLYGNECHNELMAEAKAINTRLETKIKAFELAHPSGPVKGECEGPSSPPAPEAPIPTISVPMGASRPPLKKTYLRR